jgi:branched-chain amino acid transport system substrate-binding protein
VLSLSGAGLVVGDSQKNGIQLALETINKQGGVAGAKLSVEIQDDLTQPDQAVRLFDAQVKEKKVLGIIGPSLAISAAQAHPEANKLRVPVIAPSSLLAGVVGECAYPCDFIFRDSLPEKVAIPANVKALAQGSHARSAAIFYAADDSLGTADAVIFQQAFTDNGITVASDAVVQLSKNDTAFGDGVTAVLAKKPDVWAVSTPGAEAAALMTEARKQGFKGTFLGGNSFNSAGVSRLAGDAGKGARSATAYYPALNSTANREFATAYRAAFKGVDGQPLEPDLGAAQAYSAVLLFAEAARHAHLTFGDPSADRVRLRDALAAVNLATPMGAFSFTPEHDVRQPVYVVAMDGKGGFSLVQAQPPR